MVPRKIDLAAWEQKAAMNQLSYPVSKITGKIRPVVS
jgi:hypothetical protein